MDSKPENRFLFNQSEFLDDFGVGLKATGELYVPDGCKDGKKPCKLLFYVGGYDNDFARYAENNDIVCVWMSVGGHVDRSRFPNACGIMRGLSEMYGQLGSDYASVGVYSVD